MPLMRKYLEPSNLLLGMLGERYYKEYCDQHLELPNGIEDPKIAAFAKENGYTVVTKDVGFVNYCKKENVPVGVLKGNRLYLISDSVDLFGGKTPDRLFTPD